MKVVAFEIARLVEIHSLIDDRIYIESESLEANREYFQKNKADITAYDLAHNIAENKELRDSIDSLHEDQREVSIEAKILLEHGLSLDNDDFSKFARLKAVRAI